MSRDLSILVLCASLSLACTSSGDATPASSAAVSKKEEPAVSKQEEPAVSKKEEPAEAAPDSADPAPSPEPALGPRFWVASGGLHAYDLDGARLASLGDRGDHARRLADGRIVVVDDSALGARLSVLDAKGKPTLELELPTVFDDSSCSMTMNVLEKDGESEEQLLAHEGLSMQSNRDFSLNAAGTHACISLLDRNENMADYSIDLAVNLATGKVESAVGYAVDDSCPEASLAVCKDHARSQPWIEGVEATATAKKWAHAYDPETGALSRAGEVVRELCVAKAERGDDWDPRDGGCLMSEEVSSSGRWLLVTAQLDLGGDYIYRQLYLFDLETAALSTLVCEDEGSCTMEKVGLERLFVGEEPPGYSIVGESEIGSLPGDRFWIEGKLLNPADGKLVEIGGTRALSAGK